ncbi:protein D3-like [Teleopsis dalmanni]|uniref:protein D3-like n=1 Tax=Teleopsis dalmanni TaxID=139649 RepID=UPI0018CF78B6|nr:protein D3-like [Teleopsis dalmanni]
MHLIKIFKNALCTFFVITIAFVNAMEEDEVEKVFKAHEVVPDVILTPPKQFLKITYENGLTVDKGADLTPTQVKSEPKVDWVAEENIYYTLIMTDPDAPTRTDPKLREVHHWLVGNIPGNAIEQGEVITAYVGSGPPEGTGLHRYVFLLYKQPSKLEFDEPRVSNRSRNNRPKFSAKKFTEKYNLGTPIAGNFYQAQWDEYVPIVHKQLSGN